MVPPESGGLINLYGKVFSFACARVDGIQSEPTLEGGLDKISVVQMQVNREELVRAYSTEVMSEVIRCTCVGL